MINAIIRQTGDRKVATLLSDCSRGPAAESLVRCGGDIPCTAASSLVHVDTFVTSRHARSSTLPICRLDPNRQFGQLAVTSANDVHNLHWLVGYRCLELGAISSLFCIGAPTIHCITGPEAGMLDTAEPAPRAMTACATSSSLAHSGPCLGVCAYAMLCGGSK